MDTSKGETRLIESSATAQQEFREGIGFEIDALRCELKATAIRNIPYSVRLRDKDHKQVDVHIDIYVVPNFRTASIAMRLSCGTSTMASRTRAEMTRTH